MTDTCLSRPIRENYHCDTPQQGFADNKGFEQCNMNDRHVKWDKKAAYQMASWEGIAQSREMLGRPLGIEGRMFSKWLCIIREGEAQSKKGADLTKRECFQEGGWGGIRWCPWGEPRVLGAGHLCSVSRNHRQAWGTGFVLIIPPHQPFCSCFVLFCFSIFCVYWRYPTWASLSFGFL